MSNDLRAMLRNLLKSGTDSNPALNSLLEDYARYHFVLVGFAGAFVVGFLILGVFSLRRVLKSPMTDARRWTFERRTYLFFGLTSLSLALAMAFIVGVNLLNALDPRPGFSGTLSGIGSPSPGTPRAELHEAFATWLQSGSTERPVLVQDSINDRLAWQRPKAIVCGLLLVGLVAAGTRIWRTLIERSRVRATTGRDRLLLAAGIGSAMVCLLLMIMVIANTQASLAPLGLTLVNG